MSNNTEEMDMRWREYAIDNGLEAEEIREWTRKEIWEYAIEEVKACEETGEWEGVSEDMARYAAAKFQGEVWDEVQDEPTTKRPIMGDIVENDGNRYVVVGVSRRYNTMMVAQYESHGRFDIPRLDIWNNNPRAVLGRDMENARIARDNSDWDEM
jgi:hypothetical protein